MKNFSNRFIPENKERYLDLVVYIFLFLFLVTGFYFFFFKINQGEIHQILYTADAMYIPALYRDIFIDGYKLSGWIVPPSNYFFPDMVVFFLCMFLFNDIVPSIFAYAIIQFLILLFIFFTLFKGIFHEKESRHFAGQLILFAGGVIIFLSGAGFNSATFSLLFVSGFHTGSFLITMICLIFLINLILKKQKRYYFFLFITASAGILSDILFVAQFIIPALLSLIFIALYEKKTSLIAVITILLSLIFAFQLKLRL